MLSYCLEIKVVFMTIKVFIFFKGQKMRISKGLTHSFGQKIQNFF